MFCFRFEDNESPRYALYRTLIRTFTLDGVVIAMVLTLGQEIYRLVLLDFIFGLVGTYLAELIRCRIFK